MVPSSRDFPIKGWVVWVTGLGGYRHYYAHLESWADQAQGDWVEAGEVIGFVGNSGNAAGGPTHLHYGIYAPFGGAINAFPDGACTTAAR